MFSLRGVKQVSEPVSGDGTRSSWSRRHLHKAGGAGGGGLTCAAVGNIDGPGMLAEPVNPPFQLLLLLRCERFQVFLLALALLQVDGREQAVSARARGPASGVRGAKL